MQRVLQRNSTSKLVFMKFSNAGSKCFNCMIGYSGNKHSIETQLLRLNKPVECIYQYIALMKPYQYSSSKIRVWSDIHQKWISYVSYRVRR